LKPEGAECLRGERPREHLPRADGRLVERVVGLFERAEQRRVVELLGLVGVIGGGELARLGGQQTPHEGEREGEVGHLLASDRRWGFKQGFEPLVEALGVGLDVLDHGAVAPEQAGHHGRRHVGASTRRERDHRAPTAGAKCPRARGGEASGI
jgi:hypothetical protein